MIIPMLIDISHFFSIQIYILPAQNCFINFQAPVDFPRQGHQFGSHPRRSNLSTASATRCCQAAPPQEPGLIDYQSYSVYPAWFLRFQKANWKMAIEIVEFPMKHGDFPVRYVSPFTRG
jgi:hypothetical protein